MFCGSGASPDERRPPRGEPYAPSHLACRRHRHRRRLPARVAGHPSRRGGAVLRAVRHPAVVPRRRAAGAGRHRLPARRAGCHHRRVRRVPAGGVRREPPGGRGRARHVGTGPRAAIRDRGQAGERDPGRVGRDPPRRGAAARPGHAAVGGGEAGREDARDPVGGRERARRRGVRHGRVAAGALRVGRPGRLRGAAGAGQRARGDPADAEPGRPGGGHPPERLRLRHEPRLVRPHPAGDRRQADRAAELPAGAVHRLARDGRPELLRPAERRPDLPRDHRRVGGLDQQPVRRVDGGGVHQAGHRLLQPRRLRPVLHGIRRHGPVNRVHRRRHDVREGRRRPDLRPPVRAVRRDVDVARRRGAGQGGAAGRLARRLRPGLPAGAGREAGAERDRQPGQRADHPGAGRAGAALLPALRRPEQGPRGAGAGAPAAADGGARLHAHRAAAGAGLHPVRPSHRTGHAARRHLLGADGAGAEALGAGDAARGHLRAVPVLLRRDRVEPAAAVQRRGRPLRCGAGPDGLADPAAAGAGAGADRRCAAGRGAAAVRIVDDRDRVDRVAALAAGSA